MPILIFSPVQIIMTHPLLFSYSLPKNIINDLAIALEERKQKKMSIEAKDRKKTLFCRIF